MAEFKVLMTDFAWPDVELEREVLARCGAELIVAEESGAAALAKLAADVDGILSCWAEVPAEVIDAAHRCRIIARMGIGLDNIDLQAAAARGIVVTNVPDYCLTEVAEHTLALLLALGRNVAWFHQQTKSGVYDLKSGPPLRRIAGQTLGIVGLGEIGREVARRAQALGLRVIACSRTQENPPPEGIAWCKLPDLLAESDYVSLHLPLNAETRHLIDAAALQRMKPTAFLINTARGGLVDHAALAAALEAGQLAGAALDVQDPEPPDLSQPPYNHPRVIVTPHAAFASEQSVQELRTRAAEEVVACLTGGQPKHVVG